MLEPIRLFEEKFGPIRYVLAPMSGITDSVFRLLMREMGVEAVVSELVSAEGMVRRQPRTLCMLEFTEAERPIGIQLFGASKTSLVEAAKMVEQTGADFVDLNLGCPVNKVVKKGGGAAWLRDVVELGRLLVSVKKGVNIPLTIKVRTGWDAKTVNIREVVQVAAESGVDWVAPHGRTRAQSYTGVVDWELIREVAQNSPVPIIGNGDITNACDAVGKIKDGYAHAIMIGRGALKNPWIFQQIQGTVLDHRSCLDLVSRHFDLAMKQKDGRRALYSLRKFVSWYTSGFPHSTTFRGEIFETRDVDRLFEITKNYLMTTDIYAEKKLTQHLPMGGHG